MGDRDSEETVRDHARARERVVRTELGPGAPLGRFVVLDMLGAGGMGVVYSAYDAQLDRRVAIKLLGTDALESSDAELRLLREAQAMAKIDHPNVIKVHEVGTHAGQVYLAMEFSDAGNLRGWLDERARTLPEIVGAYVQAGRGLAAAHAAGLVHRDFKPENVLVSTNGSVRVTDFGLVSAANELLPAQRDSFPPGTALSQSVTRTGAVMGTPSYMSPEQFDGDPASPAADQFAFCVALYEACYGERPFRGDSALELAENVKSGEIAAPPASKHVPDRLRRVIVRGLARDPSRRYPSMTALLDDLSRDPSRARRRVALAAGAVLVPTIAVTALLLVRRDAATACASGSDRLAVAWNPVQQQSLERAFSASPLPGARAAAARLLPMIDDWARSWSNAYVDACRATRVRGDQSEHVLDLRMQCLDRQLEQARVTFELFASHPDDAVAHGANAIRGLSVASCGDPAALASAVRPPEGLLARAEVAAIRAELDAGRAERRLGRYKEGVAIAQRAVAEARLAGHRATLGEALLLAGNLQIDLADRASVDTLGEAARALAEASDTSDVIDALASRVYALATTSRYDLGRELLGLADAIAVASPPAVEIAIRLGDSGALLFSKSGDKKAAQLRYEQTLALGRARIGPESPEVVTTMNQLAIVEMDQSRYAEAEAMLQQALAIRERQVGRDHPDIASMLSNLAMVYRNEAKLDDARKTCERALAIDRATLGEQHPEVGTQYNSYGNVLWVAGDRRQALEYFRKALANWEAAYGPRSPEIVTALLNIGQVQMELGEPTDARQALERAAALLQSVHGPDDPALADVWMSLGGVARNEGKLDEALVLYQRAQGISEKAYGPVHRDVADDLANIASIYNQQGKQHDAQKAYERLLVLGDQVYGPDHPHVAMYLTNYANLLQDLGDHAGALEASKRASSIFEAKLGKDTPYLAYSLESAGQALVDLHRANEAVPILERALALREADDSTPQLLAETRFALAGALAAEPQSHARAVELARKALAGFKEAKVSAAAAEVQKWLAGHE